MFIMFFVIFLPCNCPSRNRRQSRGPRSIQQGPTKAFGIVEVNGLPRWDHVLLGEILPGYTRILQSFYLNMVISYIDIGISRFIYGYHILSIIHINKKGAPDFLKTPTQPENMTRGIQGIWIKYPGLRSSWAVKSRFFQGLDGKNGAQVGTTETVDDMFMFYMYAHLYIYINIIYRVHTYIPLKCVLFRLDFGTPEVHHVFTMFGTFPIYRSIGQPGSLHRAHHPEIQKGGQASSTTINHAKYQFH